VCVCVCSHLPFEYFIVAAISTVTALRAGRVQRSKGEGVGGGIYNSVRREQDIYNQ
jgi:hypothetical protein